MERKRKKNISTIRNFNKHKRSAVVKAKLLDFQPEPEPDRIIWKSLITQLQIKLNKGHVANERELLHE